MIARSVMGGAPALVLRTPSSRTRECRNPFTGEVEVYPINDFKDLPTVASVAGAIAMRKDYAIEVSGMGRPGTPPVPIAFQEPYHVGVTCLVSSQLRSTSDLHEESGSTRKLPYHGRPCDGAPSRGFFSNPHTLEVIKVPGGGCALFWVEFELGKSLFPPFDQGNLKFLNPVIVAEATQIFGIKFVQGCCWG